jgi:hypothetical protein
MGIQAGINVIREEVNDELVGSSASSTYLAVRG